MVSDGKLIENSLSIGIIIFFRFVIFKVKIHKIEAKLVLYTYSVAWGIMRLLVLKLLLLKELGIMHNIALEGKSYYWDK